MMFMKFSSDCYFHHISYLSVKYLLLTDQQLEKGFKRSPGLLFRGEVYL